MSETLQPAPTAAATFTAQFDDYICAQLRPCNESRLDFAEFVDSLSQRNRHALAVQAFHGQVCNGGFSQWFGNGYYDDDLATLNRALARMEQTELVKAVAALIDRATQIIVNDDGYDAKHHDLSDHGYEALDGLDNAYYAVAEAFDALFSEYFMTWA
ncbi:DUF4375 domain-containing protein [Deinococcus psychrotolerans]|uniref:DUF4375 domain-containing protein n=1 Tax=Deinococcus psychrotolerans TaxID=2489213 RepID=A0A3G8YFE5_9DEIO|nr:DUF4375 domain-containing protein [Deinococcus psychrotolerans]AZI44002.1 DUF4375 domain-containing protein [Deinococcus psychrotolerans]